MRSRPEWIEPNHDKPIPSRVKQRVADRANKCCQACGVRIASGGQIDHIVALINGGEHRETNLRLLCRNCHGEKTKTDLATKSRAAKTQKRMGPLRREQSAWSKKLEAYEYDWTLKRYVPKKDTP